MWSEHVQAIPRVAVVGTPYVQQYTRGAKYRRSHVFFSLCVSRSRCSFRKHV